MLRKVRAVALFAVLAGENRCSRPFREDCRNRGASGLCISRVREVCHGFWQRDFRVDGLSTDERAY